MDRHRGKSGSLLDSASGSVSERGGQGGVTRHDMREILEPARARERENSFLFNLKFSLQSNISRRLVATLISLRHALLRG